MVQPGPFPVDLTRLVMGTGGVTDPTNAMHVRVVRAAMDAELWFHVADYGGGVYRVLAKAFDEAPAQRPRCIVKLDGTNARTLKTSVLDCLKRTGLDQIDLGQVCAFPYCEDRDALFATMNGLRTQGLVGSYIMDVIPAYSATVIDTIEAGAFAGYIFYLNAMEREVSNRAWDLLTARHVPVIAMRTFGGRGAANYFHGVEANPRKLALEPLVAAAGCASTVEFLVRLPLSLPSVRATVGSTGDLTHFEAFRRAGHAAEPLPPEIVHRVQALHRDWAHPFGD